jgi:hypothetical protein
MDSGKEPLWPPATLGRVGYGSSTSHRPSLGRIERSESTHKSRNSKLYRRQLFSMCILLRPLICLLIFFAIGGFGFFCFADEPNDHSSCNLCCFGRISTSEPTTPLWILWLSLGVVGVLGPFVCIFACALCQRPSKRQRMKEDFYADALLAEMLNGDNVADHYDVRGSVPGQVTRGTIVILGGLGTPRSAADVQSEAAVNAGYKTISIDVPSHGTLSAVTYSLARCERVILRVMQREALLEERARRRLGSMGSGGGGSFNDRIRSGSIRKDRSVGGDSSSVPLAPFLICAYGAGTQTALHFTSRHPDLIAGLFLFGPIVNLNDPGVCGCGCCSGHGCFGCGCCFGHGFGCCVNGSAMIGNAPCSSIYRMRWANYLEDSMIRRRLFKSTIPLSIKKKLFDGKEFQVSAAIEWNYEIRHRNLLDDMHHSGYDRPIRVVAGATSSNFIEEISNVIPHTTCTYISRIGDQYLPVWKWKECNEQLLEFVNTEVFPIRRKNVVTGGSGSVSHMMYVGALRREKSANVW